MRNYGRVMSTIWGSYSFRELSEDGRMLVMYLLTCQHGTILGAFHLPLGYVAEDLQWSSARVAKGFHECSETGWVARCDATQWVWIAEYLRWNPLENPNQRKAAADMARMIPDRCEWGPRFQARFHREEGDSEPPEFPLEPRAKWATVAEPLANPSGTLPQSVSVTVTVEGTVTGEKRERGGSRVRARGKRPASAGADVSVSEPAPDKPLTVDDLVTLGIERQVASDWLRVRVAKGGKVLTRTAWDAVVAEAEKAGMSAADAVKIAAEKEWRGFKAEWLIEERGRLPGAAAKPARSAEDEAEEMRRLMAGASAAQPGLMVDGVEVIDGGGCHA